VGKLPAPRTFEQGADMLKRMMSAQFTTFSDAQWERMARGTWREADGALVPLYDPALMRTLEAIDIEAPLPDLWPLFGGLAAIPVLALRGANSDLLSAQTLAAMRKAHPSLQAVTVPDQGHAPVLEGDLVDVIRRFVATCDPG
jgi:pimeloyl-ACP methyl ester carboxylesterase